MLKQLSIVLFLTLLISAYAQAQGRAPAVEPEMGISIDEYEEVHSGPEKGFDFTQANPGVSAAVNQQTRPLTGQNPISTRTPNSVTTKERAPSPIWTLIALTALPLAYGCYCAKHFPRIYLPQLLKDTLKVQKE